MSDSLKETLSDFNVSSFINEAGMASFTESLLKKFPELKTKRARSLGEAIDIVLPWIKSAAIVGISALAVNAIGAAALALSTKVLLALAIIALALYLISKIGPPAVEKKLDEIFEKINSEFSFSEPVSLSVLTSELRGSQTKNVC